MNRFRRRQRAWQAAFYLTLLAAAYFLLAPGVPSTAGVPYGDKVAHAALFATLGILARLAHTHPAWGLFTALALLGAATEFAQRDIPGRQGDVWDLVANLLGAAIVFLLPTPRQPTEPPARHDGP